MTCCCDGDYICVGCRRADEIREPYATVTVEQCMNLQKNFDAAILDPLVWVPKRKAARV